MFNKSFLSENRGEANTSQVFVPSIDLKLMMFCWLKKFYGNVLEFSDGIMKGAEGKKSY